MSTAIVWFRRDLRVHDHPALHRAASEFDRVVPLFVLDPALLRGRYRSAPREAFMLACLAALDGELRERGAGLVVREGDPREVVPAVAREAGADAVLWTSDVSRYARARDAAVAERVPAVPHGGNYVVDVGKVKPYVVFSPFWRAWQALPRRDVLDAPDELRGALEPTGVPGRDAPFALPPAGERAAWERVDALDGYEQDVLAGGSTGLSPYLRWGCVSPLALERRVTDEALRRQLCWRDFHAHVLLHHPGNLDAEFRERYRDLDWDEPDDAYDAWREGRTGFPVVDAGMRQLARTGWMHNRARLIAGSFLTKDLHLDWRLGEAHFARLLLDGEPAQNNGNWQWIASTGVDPAPYFRRMYNPERQQRRHDPDGAYVRRWVEELRDVDTADLFDPPPEVRAATGYPDPIVDHLVERRRAMARYKAVSDAG